MTSCLRRLAIAAAVLVPSFALAILPHAPEGLVPGAEARLRTPPFVVPVVDHEQSKVWAATDPAFRAFVAEAGAEWRARWDARTATLSAAWGTFPAWLPADARVATPEDRDRTLSALDAQARALIARHPGLFALPPGVSLSLDPLRSVALDGGRVWQVAYAVTRGGVPVEGASVFFRLNSGRLVQLGQEGIDDALALAASTPTVSSEEARARGTSEAAALFGTEAKGATTVAPPRLALLPSAGGQGLTYRLAWRTSQRVTGRPETWTAWIDATTGERLFLWDDNRYACPAPARPQGRVVGGVYLGAIEEVTEVLRGMPNVRVEHGAPLTTDVNGVFPYTPGTPAETTLSGSFFDVECADCENPAQALTATTSWGPLSLGMGGVNTVGNGFSTKAERNAFYHLNISRQIASKHLDDAAAGGFFTRNTPAVVNIGFFDCNAFWDGNSVNFVQASAACNNTGEIADVMQHEWGHGLDQFTGGGADGARGEGLSDVISFLSTHDARLGPYFFRGDGRGIRNADENVTGLMSTGTVGSVCPFVGGGGGGGPLGYEVHCEGEIFSQAWWHLARNLRQKAVTAGGSDAAGWFLTEKLFFQSLPTSRTYVPDGAQPTYDAVMVVDDDDGDLTNGTPNAAEINEAFEHHGMAPTTLVPDSADCVPPPAPGLSLTSAVQPDSGMWQVHATWTPVPGAVEYRLVRNQADGAGADEPVATVMAPATEFFDDDVFDGVTYRYRVIAFATSGCASVADNQQQVSVAALPSVVLGSWAIDDAGNPGGNFNGIPEPGETLVMPLSALNAGSGDATGVVAEITSAFPGVTIVRGSLPMGDMPAGGRASIPDPYFAVTLASSIACGAQVPFVVSFESLEGCSTGGFVLEVGNPPEPCEAPDPRPRLRYEGFAISDGAASGGTGDASLTAEPGEVVRLPVDLFNHGNATARTIQGALSLVAGPPGTLVSDPVTPWLDMRANEGGTSSGSPAHVEVTVPSSAPCGSTIDLSLRVTYTGPAGSYELTQPLALFVGRIVEAYALATDFEGGSDQGFTHGASCTNPGCDDWQRDSPTQTFPGDPAAAHSGDRCWGNDHGTLVPQGSNGQYRRDTTSWLQSPAIDCTSLVGTKIRYRRWLSVEGGEFDRARVLIATADPPGPGDWTELWRNADGADHVDTAWTPVEHDVSAIADGSATVRVRFELTSDGGYELGGWNVDDLQVMTSDVVCGSCAVGGAPSSPGSALRATGRRSESSAEFRWTAAGALQPGEEWRLYRGTAGGAVTTLLTSPGLTADTFEDVAAPDALYFYNLFKANCASETP